jgi:hypothetical protein
MANKNVVAPQLPAPPDTYDATYINLLLSVLRQYFNQLDNSGPINVASSNVGMANVVSAISCMQTRLDTVTDRVTPTISLPTQADFANLRAGDIYYDTSGGTATSYPLRIKA